MKKEMDSNKKIAIISSAALVVAASATIVCVYSIGNANSTAPEVEAPAVEAPAVESTTAEVEELVLTDYVVLPNYAEYEVTTQRGTLSDEEIKDYINTYVTSKIPVTGRTAEMGDIVVIDYAVHNDVTEHEHMSDAELTIGSLEMLEDFENAIIGMSIDEEKEYTLIYPDTVEGLAGVEAEVDVTLKGIYEATDYDTISDLDLTAVTGYKDKETLWNEVKSDMEKDSEALYHANLQLEISDYLLSNSHLNGVPDSLQKATEASYAAYLDVLANTEASMTYFEYLKTSANATEYEYQKEISDAAYEVTVKQLIYNAFAKAEGIEVSDADITQKVESIYEDMGFASADEMVATLGSDICKMYVLQEKVGDWFITK